MNLSARSKRETSEWRDDVPWSTNLLVSEGSLLLLPIFGFDHLEIFRFQFLFVRRSDATFLFLPFAELRSALSTGLNNTRPPRRRRPKREERFTRTVSNRDSLSCARFFCTFSMSFNEMKSALNEKEMSPWSRRSCLFTSVELCHSAVHQRRSPSRWKWFFSSSFVRHFLRIDSFFCPEVFVSSGRSSAVRNLSGSEFFRC